MLKDLPLDQLMDCLKFLSPPESGICGNINKSFNKAVHHVGLWRYYSELYLSHHLISQASKISLRSCMMCLRVTTIEQFVRCLYDLTLPIIGWFRIIPPVCGNTEHKGGIASIRPACVDGLACLMYEVFDAVGKVVSSGKIFFSAPQKSLVLMFGDIQYIVGPRQGKGESGRHSVSSTILFDPAGVGAERELRLLPPLSTLSSRGFDPSLQALQGLFTGVYGGHGRELLHCSIVGSPCASDPEGMHGEVAVDRDNDERCLDCDVSLRSLFREGSYYQGLKIIGDPNIPANRVSFVVSSAGRMDIAAAIEADARPLLRLLDEGNEYALIPVHECFSPSIIAAWYKGWGQINHDPSDPQYRWVRLSLVTHRRSPLERADDGSGIAFSVIWEDEEYECRQLIDFVCAPQFRSEVGIFSGDSRSECDADVAFALP